MDRIVSLIAGCALLLCFGTACSGYASRSNAAIEGDLLRHVPKGSSSATALAYLRRTARDKPLYIKDTMMDVDGMVAGEPHKITRHFYHGLIISTLATYQGFDLFNTKVLAWLEFDAKDRLIDVKVSKHENAF